MNKLAPLSHDMLSQAKASAARGLLFLGFVTAVILRAATDANEEIVELNKLVVNTDVGRYAEQTTTAASKLPIELRELPFSVSIFNEASINDHVAKKLDDIYPYVTGMTREAPTVVTGFNIRGFTSTGQGILQNVQVDNLPGATTRFGSPTTVNAERVEVIKGPTSILYGQLTPGGMINIVTKRPKLVPQTTVTASVSSFAGQTATLGEQSSLIGTIDTTGPLGEGKQAAFRLIVSGENVESYRRYSYAKNIYIYPSFSYYWSKNTSLTVLAEVTREKRHADDLLNTPPFLDVNNLPSIDITYQEKADIDRDWGESLSTSFQHEFSSLWKLTVTTRDLAHGDSRFAFPTSAVGGNVVAALPLENSSIKRYFQHREILRNYNFIDANMYGTSGSDKVQHTFLAGLNGGVERSDNNIPQNYRNTNSPFNGLLNLYSPALGVISYPPADVPVAPSHTLTHYYNYGAYASDRIKFGNKLHLLVGLRYDRQDSDFIDYVRNLKYVRSIGRVLRQGGIVYDINQAFALYASYSESFRPPLLNGSVDLSGNPNFTPETGRQIECGLKAETPNRNVILSLSLYDIQKQNVTESTGTTTSDGRSILRLVGEQESKGVECELTVLPEPNWQFQVGATYIDAETTQATNKVLVGLQFPNVAHVSGNLWTRYNLTAPALKGLGIGAGIIYQGRRLGGVAPSELFSLPGFTRIDGALYYAWKRYSLSLNVSNLLDRKYVASTGEFSVFPGEPRKLTFTFNTRL